MIYDDEATVTLAIDVRIEVSIDDVFPDGIPEVWDVDTVAAAVKASGRDAAEFLEDWSLQHTVDVIVEVQDIDAESEARIVKW